VQELVACVPVGRLREHGRVPPSLGDEGLVPGRGQATPCLVHASPALDRLEAVRDRSAPESRNDVADQHRKDPGRGESEKAGGGPKPILRRLKPDLTRPDPDHVRLAPEKSPTKHEVCRLDADRFRSRSPRFRADVSGLRSAKEGADWRKVRLELNPEGGEMAKVGVHSGEALVGLKKVGVDSDQPRFPSAEGETPMKDARVESGGSGFQSDESRVESAEAGIGLKKVGAIARRLRGRTEDGRGANETARGPLERGRDPVGGGREPVDEGTIPLQA